VTGQLLERSRTHVKLTLDEARQSVWDLRQASLGSGLVSSLSEYAAQLSREKNVEIQTEISGTPVALDEKIDRNLLLVAREAVLVAREAVRNAVAHASPRQVSIRLSFQPSQVKLEVVDDGRGFRPPVELAPDTGCYGLVGMCERIEQLGGRFLLRSEPGAAPALSRTCRWRGRSERRSSMAETGEIRVMVVDDHPVVRFGLVAMIAAQPDMEAVAQAGTGAEAVEMFHKHRPDVTLMDLRLPEMGGVEAIRAIRTSYPDSLFIVLTTYQGDEDIHRALTAGSQRTW
jgi:CheY-like chemotaxis protein